ncbi:helix-turn-helix domain-containing protein [Gordonia amicalis]|uniref:helix-turn-helix domain-containing protein n=1 Tax=Gordonia amicalis TaxID=89053 RepID=UPI003A7FBC9F
MTLAAPTTPATVSEPTPASEAHRLLAVDEARQLLGVSKWTLYRLIREQQLDTVKIGARRFVPADALHRFIEALPTSSGGGI